MLNTSTPKRDATIGMEHLLRRIQGEFLEMPGLRLTARQAQRLWDLDDVICESLLAALVDVRFLSEHEGLFFQRTDAMTTVRPANPERFS
jgi:hypothetical protein